MVDADIFNAHRLLLTEKPLTKNASLVFQKSTSKSSYMVDAKIFKGYRLLLTEKPLTKTESLPTQK